MRYFDNDMLSRHTDSALLPMGSKKIAFTTDSYVVSPIFFPGGDIGKLAVCGTVNDLAVSGAKPLYLSASFILEEGLLFEDLITIVKSMAEEAEKAGVKIVTGDTKVVNRGMCDNLFITTTGVGEIDERFEGISSGENMSTGDLIFINGSVADHGMTVMSAREGLTFEEEILSDCASLNGLIHKLLDAGVYVKFMRDATRGGMATVLAELASACKVGIDVYEDAIPVKESIKGLCEMLGFDPLYVANEGKVIFVIDPGDEEKALKIMQQHEYGVESNLIGKITDDHKGLVVLQTLIGGRRVLDMLSGEQLSRIC